jgi:hypothetical protein
MGLLAQSPSCIISLACGHPERVVFREVKLLQPLLQSKQKIEMGEQVPAVQPGFTWYPMKGADAEPGAAPGRASG